MVIIHTIGDSHSSFGWKTINNVKIHHIGAKLCYSFGKKGFDDYNILQEIECGEVVVFCFGEVDCRCHIIKQITKENTY